jgi:type IV secretory pathway TrbF-like protein
MKQRLRQLFAPLLKPLESGKVGPNYKASHRTVLNVVGVLFLVLATVSITALVYTGKVGALVPVLVFLGVGGVCVVVGTLGSDVAVSKMWGNR